MCEEGNIYEEEKTAIIKENESGDAEIVHLRSNPLAVVICASVMKYYILLYRIIFGIS